jgi:hypothetical protein
LDYDDYALLPVRTTDLVGNTMAARYDYRVLAAAELTDVNGNRAAAAFDTLGAVVGSALMGPAGERIGDQLASFRADLTEAELAAYLTDPSGKIAADLLGGKRHADHLLPLQI